jgi:Bacterial TSP3 repeat
MTTEAGLDSDGDGLSNGQEVNQLGTKPDDADSDATGSTRAPEVNPIDSNPNVDRQ